MSAKGRKNEKDVCDKGPDDELSIWRYTGQSCGFSDAFLGEELRSIACRPPYHGYIVKQLRRAGNVACADPCFYPCHVPGLRRDLHIYHTLFTWAFIFVLSLNSSGIFLGTAIGSSLAAVVITLAGIRNIIYINLVTCFVLVILGAVLVAGARADHRTPLGEDHGTVLMTGRRLSKQGIYPGAVSFTIFYLYARYNYCIIFCVGARCADICMPGSMQSIAKTCRILKSTAESRGGQNISEGVLS